MQDEFPAFEALRGAARARHVAAPSRPAWHDLGSIAGIVVPLLLSLLSLAFYVDRTLTEHSAEIRRIEAAQQEERADIADLRIHVDDKFHEVSVEIFDLATGQPKQAEAADAPRPATARR